MLLIKTIHVIDPASNTDGIYDILIKDNKVKLEVEKASVAFNRLQEVFGEMQTLNTKIQKLEDYFG